MNTAKPTIRTTSTPTAPAAVACKGVEATRTLKFDDVVPLLEKASSIIISNSVGNEVLATGRFYEDEGDGPQHAKYRITAEYMNDIVLKPGMILEVTRGNRGFKVAASGVCIFPQSPMSVIPS